MTPKDLGFPQGTEFVKLEEALVRAGKVIAYPPVPPLSGRVREQLTASQTRPELAGLRHFLSPARRPVLLLVALLLALMLLIVFPDTREALAQLFGLRTVRILFVTPTRPAQPTVTPTGTVTPPPTHMVTPTLKPLAQCCETTLTDAQNRAQFKILLPPEETPSRVYFQEIPGFPGAQQVILIFGDPGAPRMTLYQAQNVVYGKVLFVYGKEVDSGTVLAETAVNGQRALWLAGAPHILVYLDASGQQIIVGTERPVNANTLAWEQGEVTLRLETNLPQIDAVRLAESLR